MTITGVRRKRGDFGRLRTKPSVFPLAEQTRAFVYFPRVVTQISVQTTQSLHVSVILISLWQFASVSVDLW